MTESEHVLQNQMAIFQLKNVTFKQNKNEIDLIDFDFMSCKR